MLEINKSVKCSFKFPLVFLILNGYDPTLVLNARPLSYQVPPFLLQIVHLFHFHCANPETHRDFFYRYRQESTYR